MFWLYHWNNRASWIVHGQWCSLISKGKKMLTPIAGLLRKNQTPGINGRLKGNIDQHQQGVVIQSALSQSQVCIISPLWSRLWCLRRLNHHGWVLTCTLISDLPSNNYVKLLLLPTSVQLAVCRDSLRKGKCSGWLVKSRSRIRYLFWAQCL